MVPKIFVYVNGIYLGIAACPTAANHPSLLGDAVLLHICNFKQALCPGTCLIDDCGSHVTVLGSRFLGAIWVAVRL